MKNLVIFFPFVLTIMLFLELFGGIKIPYLSPLEPIGFFLGNFSENANFKIFGYALLGFFVSIFGIFFYTMFLLKYIKFSMLFPYIYYFGKNNNNRIFLKKLLQNLNFKNIFSIIQFYFLAFKIASNKNFSISDENLAILDLPKNIKNQMETLNIILKRHIGKENFVKNVDFRKNEYMKFFINKAELTSDEVIKKFTNISNEIEKFFGNKNFEAGIDIFSRNFNEIEVVIFNKKSLWENRKLDFDIFSLQKGELLLGFLQKIKNGVEYFDYKIFAKNLNHSIVSASSRSGKDVLLANIIFSILWNIKNFENMELHFFDTKGVDGAYLDNLKHLGIYRYTNIAEYSQILENILQKMRQNSKNIEEYSNIYNYNEKNPNNPIKEKFIIINEFLSLNNSLPPKELNHLLNTIISLTSEGAGFGYKIIIMSQSIRKDSSTAFSSILANIQTRFILKSFNKEEVRINTKGLLEEDILRVENMKKYNCFHIEDNSIKQEFKAYLLEQEVLKDWIGKNFTTTKSHDFSDKIQDYYDFAKQKDGISYKEATEEFTLTRSEWDKFVRILEENGEIERLPNNSIVWKK